jgi:ectoine hydroxylase-related dioxygenase (phytanoyl-CoA dioxygenase family)
MSSSAIKSLFSPCPGQAVIFDGWLFHRGGANVSTTNRRVCLMCYQNAWMKSRENFDSPRIKKLREEGSPERQLLLGGITSW